MAPCIISMSSRNGTRSVKTGGDGGLIEGDVLWWVMLVWLCFARYVYFIYSMCIYCIWRGQTDAPGKPEPRSTPQTTQTRGHTQKSSNSPCRRTQTHKVCNVIIIFHINNRTRVVVRWTRLPTTSIRPSEGSLSLCA